MTEYRRTEIAKHMIEAGYAADFISTALIMLSDPYCDLNGRVGKYANVLDDIRARVEQEMEKVRE